MKKHHESKSSMLMLYTSGVQASKGHTSLAGCFKDQSLILHYGVVMYLHCKLSFILAIHTNTFENKEVRIPTKL